MANAGNIKRYTVTEIQAMRDRGEDQTDWHRLDTMTEAELEAAIASDPDWKDIPADWYKDAVLVTPAPKQLLSLRLDADLVAWFRAQGPGYQTRMNAVLRAYMAAAAKNKAP
ncbi:MAG: BrnA antitoxin family protein [Alphaproteobacteria bacterium]|nr:BrnA antitoxin family protein [Alphaproteobacteria bacterium]